jgi:hypothetical protein
MILIGFKPVNNSGMRFYNTPSWWEPLADFVLEKCHDLFKSGEKDYFNLVSDETASRIADRLDQLIKQGAVKVHEIEYELAYPPVICNSCSGTGMKAHAECVGCRGRGKLNRSCFTEENVRAFAKFARTSRGFDIW